MKRRRRAEPDPAQPAAGPVRIRVLVAERASERARISGSLRGRADVDVVAETSSPEGALDAIEKLKHRTGTVCVVDLGLSSDGGFRLIRSLRERYPSLVVLACSDGSARDEVTRAMFVGADGFVGVQDADDALAQAVLHAGRGEVTLVGVPADWSAPVAAAAPPRKKGASKLTHRELEILRASAEGETARRIGESLGLKERTVTTHLANIYKKLGVKNRGEAIAVGIRTGLLDAPNPR